MEGKGKGIKTLGLFSSLVIALAVAASLTITVYGQQLRSTAQTKQAISRLETNTDRFSKSIDGALDRSRLDGTALEDQINALVDEFEFATDRLKDRSDDDVVLERDVREVLRRGMRLDTFMKTHHLSSFVQRDWSRVKTNLDYLARSYRVAWAWTQSESPALNRASIREVIRRLEQTSDEFRASFDDALDRSRLDGSQYEDFMNNVVATFERSVDELEKQINRSNELNPADIRLTLDNAATIDDFVKKQDLNMRARRDWSRVKANLDDLAFLNQVAWDWTARRSSSVAVSYPQRAEGERVSLTRMTKPSSSAVAREVRHELLSNLPYYSVFDWIEFEVLSDNTVVLRGEVTAPPDKKSRAEDVVEDVAGVTRVVNEIRVLPVSPNDDRLRLALYREIYNFNSPLFRYGVGSRQAIHIIVEGGRATLKGVVDTEGDKNLAYARARGVSGLFEVRNELVVDGDRQLPL